jgi:hypothetical protein
MRALAFEDPAARARLEAILHPPSGRGRRARSPRATALRVVVVPLLFETRGYSTAWRARSWSIAPRSCRSSAPRRAPGSSPAGGAIMAAQWPRWRRLQMADDVIWNGGGRGARRMRGSRDRANRDRVNWHCGDCPQSAPTQGGAGDHLRISLNERVRTLLRLEDLYERVAFPRGDESHDHHACLTGMFEILEVASRADLKSDLLQELDRQRTFLEALRSNPAISRRS